MADGRELVADGGACPADGSGVGVLAAQVGQVLGHRARAVRVPVLQRNGFGYLVHAQSLHPLTVSAWQGNGNSQPSVNRWKTRFTKGVRLGIRVSLRRIPNHPSPPSLAANSPRLEYVQCYG